ncbi:MAG: DUF2892 domain-containing protein [Phycisphaerales bacterium]
MCNCRNVGNIDRLVRAIIGLAALALAFAKLGVMEGELPGIAAAAVGLVMLGTAALGMCPLYLPFKVSTCKPGRP